MNTKDQTFARDHTDSGLLLTYSGYSARLFRSEIDGSFFGRIDGERRPGGYFFEGKTVSEAERDFRKAIDEYFWMRKNRF